MRKVCGETRRVVAILLDTKGPEIRTGKLVDHKDVIFTTGQIVTMTTDTSLVGSQELITVDYQNLPNVSCWCILCMSYHVVYNEHTFSHAQVMPIGGTILIDDGLLAFKVLDKDERTLKLEVLNNGALGENKGVNLPNVTSNSDLFFLCVCVCSCSYVCSFLHTHTPVHLKK